MPSPPHPEINTERVDERVVSGGHPVPKEKIKSRYIRSLGNLHRMALQCHRVYFFDNTDTLTPFAEVNPNGYLDIYEKDYYIIKPDWFRVNVLKKWDNQKVRVIR